MEFLNWLQNSGLAQWISGSETIWGYPTVLTLHTFGLAILVGSMTAIDLRLLGVAPGIPLDSLRVLFRPLWIAFAVNAVSGVLLFIPDAPHKAFQATFILKLAFVFLGMIVFVRTRPVLEPGKATDGAVPFRFKVLAGFSLGLWAAAIVSGRLMAYIV